MDGSDYSHKNRVVGKTVGVVLKKRGGVSFIFILTNPFHCYLSLSVWFACVCVCARARVCLCVYTICICITCASQEEPSLIVSI